MIPSFVGSSATPSLPYLDDLVRNTTMGLTVNRLGRFFDGSLAQTEDGPFAFGVPIFQVLDPVLGLDVMVLLVRIGEFVENQPFHILVNIHRELHLIVPPI
jgi:hypothetical protein